MQNIIYIIIAAGLVVMSALIPKKTRTRLVLIGVTAAIVLAEVFIFNLDSFSLISGDYQPEKLTMVMTNAENMTPDRNGFAVAEGRTGGLMFDDINKEIGTVTVHLDITGAAYADISIGMADETRSFLRSNIVSQRIVAGNEKSSTFVCRFSGKVSILRLEVKCPDDVSVSVTGVEINNKIDFSFSVVRLILFYLAAAGLYFLFTGGRMNSLFSENSEFSKRTVKKLTVMLIVAAFLVTLAQSGAGMFNLTAKSGDQISQEIVDAFEAGQVNLLEEPSAELLALDNPYDPSARSAAGVETKWDHCLYNGHYYSYYGIAPVVLLFMPYHMITGCYFPVPLAVFIFGSIGIAFLTALYMCFVKKFFPKIKNNTAIAGLLIIQLSSGIWFCFCATKFYEIAQTSGFMFVTMAAYFLLSSDIVSEGKISLIRVLFGTLCSALAVMCRPTCAVYCAVALVYLYFGLKKQIGEYKKKHKKSVIVKYLLCSLCTFAVIGAAQMVYNYLRFDSFFDFGIQYSLTINDFTAAKFYPRFVTIGVVNYLFAAPVLSGKFPFFTSAYVDCHPNGYYFIANKYAIGLIWRALPVFSYLAAPKALTRLRKADGKEKRNKALALLIPLCAAAPAAILFSIWESGYGARYCVDFSWQIVIGAFAVIFYLYTSISNKGVKEILNKGFLLSVIPAFMIAVALTFSYLSDRAAGTPEAAARLYNFATLFNIIN